MTNFSLHHAKGHTRGSNFCPTVIKMDGLRGSATFLYVCTHAHIYSRLRDVKPDKSAGSESLSRVSCLAAGSFTQLGAMTSSTMLSDAVPGF